MSRNNENTSGNIKAIGKITKSEEMYRNLVEMTTDIIYLSDREGNQVFINDAGYRTLEAVPEEVIGQQWSKWIHPDDRENTFKKIKEMIEQGIDVFDFENRYVSKRGRVIKVLHNVRVIRNEKGEIVGTQGIARDITERKQMEEELRRSEEKFRRLSQEFHALLNAIPDFLTQQFPDLKITWANKGAAEGLGRKISDLTGRYCYELWHKRSSPCESCPVQRSFVTGRIENGQVTTPEGGICELRAAPIFDEKGNVINVVEVGRDITERKRMEETLRESEQKYRTLIDNIQAGVFIIQDAKLQYINEAFARIAGYAVAEIIGKDFREFVAPDDLEMVTDRYFRRQAGENVPGEYEFRLLGKDGTRITVNMNVGLITYRGRIASMGVLTDITERKRVEEALKAAKAKAEEEKNKSNAILEAIGDNVIIQDTDYKIIYQNQVNRDLVGNRVGEYCYRVYEDRDAICEGCPLEMSFRDGKIHKAIRSVSKEKGTQHIEYTTSPLRDSSGKIIAGVKIVRDITERKRGEETLRLSEEKYRTLFETMAQGVVYQDAGGRIISANPAAERILGLTFDQMSGRTSMDPGWKAVCENGSDFPGETHPSMVALRTGREVRDVVMGVFNPLKDEYRWININAVPQFRTGEDGPYQAYTIFDDITERRRIEKDLLESEERYRSLFENSPISLWEEDSYVLKKHIDSLKIKGIKNLRAYFDRHPEELALCAGMIKIVDVNKATISLFRAKSKNDFIGGLEKIFTEKSYETFKDELIAISEGKTSFESEDIVRTLTGNEIHISLKWILTSGNEKTYSKRLVSVIDITERKRAEEALRKSEEKFRGIFEQSPIAIELYDRAGSLIDVNRSCLDLFGINNIESVIGFKLFDDPNIPEDTKKRLSNGENIEFESIFDFELVKEAHLYETTKSGKCYLDILIIPLMTEERELYGYLVYVRDITERRRVEEVLKLSNLVVENSQTVLFRWRAKDGWPVEFVSKNVAQFGYTVEDFLSGRLPYASIVHPEDMERIAMEVQKHAENGDERFQQEYRILTKNGAVRWIDDRTVIERDRDGRVTHYQGIIIDITERKKVEEAIKKYAQELEESNSIKELFIDIMHHDLINPLTAASGFIELLKEDEIKSRKRVYLETIERNLVKALELMESATRLSKLESSKSIELTDMDLEKVINEVTGNMSPLAADAGMKIENKINMSILVRANKIIEEVFANIMSNAVKYASSGKRIVLDCEKREGCWNIRVMDFGEGIEDRDKKPIFDRFHRLEKKGVKGSGLGLAIASRIMELHNGRIWVEDNPEGGAVFVVEIPKHLY